jgi:hypothetical protein
MNTANPPLIGEDCQCPTCGLTFVGERAFDRHRVGEYGAPKGHPEGRRCRSLAEMHAAGMGQNAVGQWRILRLVPQQRTAGLEPSDASRALNTTPQPATGAEPAPVHLEAA